MPDRDGYIAGVPCWIDTTQPDPDAAAEFYGASCGCEAAEPFVLVRSLDA